MIQKLINNNAPAYEILDYIITPSSSEVNTEVLVNGTTVVDMTCTLRQRSWQAPRFFSSNDTNTDVPRWNQAGTWGLQFEDSGSNLSIKMLGADYSRLSDAVIVRTGITYNDLANKKLRYNLTAAGILTIFNTDDTVFRSYDATAETDTSATSSTPIKLFHLFASHEYINNGTYVYDVKIWNNDVLIRHYLPVKRLSDNVYGLYDIINNTFHSNEVSGYSFSGASKSTPEYIYNKMLNYVNDIVINGTHINRIYNDGEIYWGNEPEKGGLPARYVHVDYIMNDCEHVKNAYGYYTSPTLNKAYIDTNYFPKVNTRVVGKIELPENRFYYLHFQNVVLFGGHSWRAPGSISTNGAIIFGLYFYNDNSLDRRPAIWAINNGAQGYEKNGASFSVAPNNMSVNDALKHIIEFEIGPEYLYEKIDDTVYIDKAPAGPPWPDIDGSSNTSSQLYLFSGVWEPHMYRWPARQPIGWVQQKLYYFKIYEGDTIVKDYIPVYDSMTDKYGLYDMVDKEFLTSPNNYNFIYE